MGIRNRKNLTLISNPLKKLGKNFWKKVRGLTTIAHRRKTTKFSFLFCKSFLGFCNSTTGLETSVNFLRFLCLFLVLKCDWSHFLYTVLPVLCNRYENFDYTRIFLLRIFRLYILRIFIQRIVNFYHIIYLCLQA